MRQQLILTAIILKSRDLGTIRGTMIPELAVRGLDSLGKIAVEPHKTPICRLQRTVFLIQDLIEGRVVW